MVLRTNRIGVFPYLLIMVFFFFCFSAKAQAFKINNYSIDLIINQSGQCEIHEIIDVHFNEERRGIFRNIPRSAIFNGEERKVKLSNVNVKDHKFSKYTEGNNNVIRIGQKDKYIIGDQRYDISYTLGNAFVFEENHIEFIYDLITEWDTEIEKMQYTIHLPTDLNMAFNDYKIITGMSGEDERNATIQKQGNIITGSTMRPLAANENVTLALKLPKGYISEPVPEPSILQKDKLWLLPGALIFMMFGMFNRSRKEFAVESRGIEQYPPEGFSPAEVGAYHDYKVNTEDLISLLPYWADKRIIQIMASEIGSKELFFKKISDINDDAPEYQKVIFDEIFKDNDLVMLSELKNTIYKAIGNSRSLIKERLIDRDLYDMDHYNMYHKGKFVAGGLLLILGAILTIIFTPFTLTGIAMIVLGICAIIIHFLRPKRTDKGIRIRSHLIKLKRFLASANPEETKSMLDRDPLYFDKLYPYAIALGVDQTWINNIKDSDIYGPSWYGYNHHTHHHQSHVPIKNFSNEFSVAEIKSVFTSYPQSSSGGSSGGGFSGGSAGGGFGGGGGSW